MIRERQSGGKFTNRLHFTVLRPAWHRSRAWWTLRSKREHVLLGMLAVIAAIALIMLTVIGPLRAVRQNAYDDLHTTALLEAGSKLRTLQQGLRHERRSQVPALPPPRLLL